MKEIRHDYLEFFKLTARNWLTTLGGRPLICLVMMSLAVLALISNSACGGQSPTTTVPTHIPYARTPSPTSTLPPSNTPTQTPTDTPNPSPTYTPTHTPTRTDTPEATEPPTRQPATTVPPAPTVSLAPVLLEPKNDIYTGGSLEFSWQWYRGLSDEGPYDGEHFALRVWHEGAEKKSITWCKQTSYPVEFGEHGLGSPGLYYWNVAVVRQTGEPRHTNWEYVSPESEIRRFHVEPPKPTPTPKDEPKPTPEEPPP